MGGDQPTDNSGQLSAQDEDRKAALRAKIDRLYGIGGKVPIYGEAPAAPARTALWVDPESGAQEFGGAAAGVKPEAPIIGYQDDPEALAARTKMAGEDKQVSDATRGYYTDALTRSFGAAERNNRFQLARQGLQGGSADIDTNAELQTDKNLGATRIDDAARRAAATLDAQREQERMNAVQLVNAGAGDSAVASAQAGLRNSLNTASTANKADLFGDLFQTGANAAFSANQNAVLAAMANQYQSRLGAFFQTPNAGGNVTRS